jgi:hypothetical protein
MSDCELRRVIDKLHKLRTLRLARDRVRRLERELYGEAFVYTLCHGYDRPQRTIRRYHESQRERPGRCRPAQHTEALLTRPSKPSGTPVRPSGSSRPQTFIVFAPANSRSSGSPVFRR